MEGGREIYTVSKNKKCLKERRGEYKEMWRGRKRASPALPPTTRGDTDMSAACDFALEPWLMQNSWSAVLIYSATLYTV